MLEFYSADCAQQALFEGHTVVLVRVSTGAVQHHLKALFTRLYAWVLI